MMMGKPLIDKNDIYEMFMKPICKRVESELREATPRKLMNIVEAWERLPFWRRKLRFPCNELYWEEKHLRYGTAKDLLQGNFTWEELDEGRKKREY